MKIKREMKFVMIAAAALLQAGCGTTGTTMDVLTGKKEVLAPAPQTSTDISAPVIGKESVLGTVLLSDDPETTQLEMLDGSMLLQRYQDYSSRLTLWHEIGAVLPEGRGSLPEGWHECYGTLARVHDGYLGLARRMEDDQTVPFDAVNNVMPLLQADISFLESPCPDIFASVSSGDGGFQPGTEVSLGAMTQRLRFFFEVKEYDPLISFYERQADGSVVKDDAEIIELYGEALAKKGRLAEAAEAFLRASAQQGGDTLALRQRAALLYLAAGKYDAARNEYHSLVESLAALQPLAFFLAEQSALVDGETFHEQELGLFAEVIKGSLLYDGQGLSLGMVRAMNVLENWFPESEYTGQARRIYSPSHLSARRWAENRMIAANDFFAGKQFDQARDVLKGLGAAALPDDISQWVHQLAEEIRLAEEEHIETRRRLVEQARAAQWQGGMDLLDHQQYDEAIVLFSELVATEYGEQAEARILEAKKLAAADLRRQAAGIFVKSRKEVDPLAKGALLVKSRDMLLEILEKYPDVDVVDKVERNLRVIEEQIYKLNPGLPGRQTVNPGQPESFSMNSVLKKFDGFC